MNAHGKARVATALGTVALGAAVAIGLAVTRTAGGIPPLDADWMAFVGGGHPSPWTGLFLFLHELGFGMPAFLMTTTITGALFLWNRPWAGVYFLVVAIVSTAVVEILKNSFGRPRPAVALVETGFGSYPSGHSARAAMLAVALGILIPRAWVWALGVAYTLAMMLSRTQLGAHWLTDTVGGALTGAAVALLCLAVIARRLEAEDARSHPPPWRGRN